MSKNYEVVNIFDACSILLKMKGNRYEFNKEIAKIKRTVESNYNELIEELELIRKEANELTLEYCKKDQNGKPVIEEVKDDTGKVIAKKYDGLMFGENPEYDERMKELNDKKRDFLKEESNIDLEAISITIKKNDLPLKSEDFDGELQAQIQQYIED